MSTGVSILKTDLKAGDITNILQPNPSTTPNGHVMTWNNGQLQWVPAPPAGASAQDLGGSLLGTTLTTTITGGTPAVVDLAPIIPADQNLVNGTLLGTVLTVGIDNGSPSVTDLSPILPNPDNFHTLGNGQTDVAVAVSAAPVTDNSLVYTGGTWNQVSHNDWSPVRQRDTHWNSDFDFPIQVTTTPASGIIGLNSNVGVTDIYLNQVQFSESYFFAWNNGLNLVPGDTIRLVGRDPTLARIYQLNLRITNVTDNAGITRFEVTATSPAFGALSLAAGQTVGITFRQQSDVYNTGVANAAAIALLPPPYVPPTVSHAFLSRYGNVGTVAVPGNLVENLVTISVTNVVGDFAPGAANTVTYNGPTRDFKMTLSVGCFANQVDRRIEFCMGKNGFANALWFSNYTVNAADSTEAQSTIEYNQQLGPADNLYVLFRLNDTTVPLPTLLTVFNVTLSISPMY